jgi:hypothetical protein
MIWLTIVSHHNDFALDPAGGFGFGITAPLLMNPVPIDTTYSKGTLGYKTCKKEMTSKQYGDAYIYISIYIYIYIYIYI